MADKPKKMTDEELLSLLNGEFTQAMGRPSGDISNERAALWQQYMSEPYGDEIEGMSAVVTSDMADVVHGIMPSLLRVFTTAENLVEFEPVGEEDVKGAEQETDTVHYVFFKKNPAFMILHDWCFDTLTQLVGYAKCWWDDSERVTYESYEGLTEAELAEMMGDEELEAYERAEREERLPEPIIGPDGKEVTKLTLHDVKFRRVTKRGQVRVVVVPGDELRVSADCHSVDLSDARMVGHEREVTRSELLEMGFDKKLVEDLPAEGNTPRTPEAQAKRTTSDERQEAPHDESQDKILLREAYYRVDWDGDGRSELRQVFIAGGKVLGNEPADRQPIHALCAMPMPHKHFGRSPMQLVKDIQRISSTLVRQILDNLYHTNNPGHAVWEQGIGENTLDDLLTTGIGTIKRFARPVSESWQPINIPYTAGHTFQMLDYWEKAKRDRTGISSEGDGLNPEALKHIQQSVLAGAVDLSKMKIEAIARIFAETGIKSLFLHIQELLKKHQDKKQVIRLRGTWTPVSPKDWRTRYDMTAGIGLGLGTREQNLIHLEAIWQRQKTIVDAGGLGSLITPMNIYNNCAELAKNAGYKTPEKFFTLVEKIPQQGGEQNRALAAQLQLAQQQLQLEQQKATLQAQRAQMDHQRAMLDLRLKAKDIEGKHMISLEEVANELTELELKFGTNVPGSRV